MRSGVGPRAELERHGVRTAVDWPGVGTNLIDHPLMTTLAALSNEAIEQATRSEYSRFSALLRYTARESPEANDVQLYVLLLGDLAIWPGAPSSSCRRFQLQYPRAPLTCNTVSPT
jgi:hypothetical protein